MWTPTTSPCDHGHPPSELQLDPASGETFATPEAVMVYSDRGLNGMSQIYHQLYRTRLARGIWRDKVRPVPSQQLGGHLF